MRVSGSGFEGHAQGGAATCLLEKEAPTVVSSASTTGSASANWVFDDILEEEHLKRLRAVFDKISAFRYLPHGWDSYGAPPIDHATQIAAKKIIKLLWESLSTSLPEPFAAPCSDGGLLLEWALPTTEVSVTVGPGGIPFEYLITRKGTDDITDEGTTRDLVTLVRRVLIHFV
ncbi:hypothetical protein MELA_02159 [Candidatus Methylomirabilis lanthanidiphila]|uniref:Uncharacterized protein n=1 Tax=Candidatus Methylomirabilis lanthanidiphila TaxID=2211376 RepID=A0A564ZKF0_9BACT|nr:hypothetical protein MELA_02159 [Candidatus Methylomirabilis lanthanidiphila]